MDQIMGKGADLSGPREPAAKILDRRKIESLLGRSARNRKTLALANGCFDIVHIGHVRYLKSAKETADVLLVAVNSDSSAKKLKGSGRPVIPEDERAEVIASFEFVDFVVIFEEENVKALISELKPDFHCKGGDYKEEDVPEREEVIKNGGVVKIVGGEKLRSSSDLITKTNQW
jgi:D-glycero-beta-D-manno-heptose 1-phosphate adenylyltransferase